MATSINDLIKGQASTDIVKTLLALLQMGKFPATSWQTASVPRQFVETEGSFLADLTQTISLIVQGGYLDDAAALTDPAWLDLLGLSFFREVRNPPLFTTITYTLTDTGGVGPTTIGPGLLLVADPTKTLRYSSTNVVPVVVPLNGSVQITLKAEQAGAAYNVAANTIQSFLSSFPGTTGTNQVGSTLTQGADIESPLAFSQRLKAKWGSITAGANEAYYRFYATVGFSEVTRVKMTEDFATGIVYVTLAGSNGGISATTFGLVNAVFQTSTRRPLCQRVTLQVAASDITSVDGVVYVDATSDLTATLQAVKQAVTALAGKSDIGVLIRLAKIIEIVMEVPGVNNVVLTSPSSDVILGSLSIWTPVFNLTASR